MRLRALLVLALATCSACRHKAAPSGTSSTDPSPSAAASATLPAGVHVEDFQGTYVTNWGKARCTQVARNVSCLYAGKSGSMDCKVIGERELDCGWDEPGASGKSRLTKQEDGRLSGTWGNGQSANNGGTWVFKPVAR